MKLKASKPTQHQPFPIAIFKCTFNDATIKLRSPWKLREKWNAHTHNERRKAAVMKIYGHWLPNVYSLRELIIALWLFHNLKIKFIRVSCMGFTPKLLYLPFLCVTAHLIPCSTKVFYALLGWVLLGCFVVTALVRRVSASLFVCCLYSPFFIADFYDGLSFVRTILRVFLFWQLVSFL